MSNLFYLQDGDTFTVLRWVKIQAPGDDTWHIVANWVTEFNNEAEAVDYLVTHCEDLVQEQEPLSLEEENALAAHDYRLDARRLEQRAGRSLSLEELARKWNLDVAEVKQLLGKEDCDRTESGLGTDRTSEPPYVLSDTTRGRLLRTLHKEPGMSVETLSQTLGLPASEIRRLMSTEDANLESTP